MSHNFTYSVLHGQMLWRNKRTDTGWAKICRPIFPKNPQGYSLIIYLLYYFVNIINNSVLICLKKLYNQSRAEIYPCNYYCIIITVLFALFIERYQNRFIQLGWILIPKFWQWTSIPESPNFLATLRVYHPPQRPFRYLNSKFLYSRQ